jgi:hypothetical protein
VSSSVENAVLQWEDGYRALQGLRSDPAAHRALGRAVVAIQEILRRELGSTFTVEELAALYRRRGDQLTDIAIQAVPEPEHLSGTATAVDAAFYLYMREAADFAGGSTRPRSS